MDWSRPTTQLLGRFQPWHSGHTELFKRALSKTGQVVILLRRSDGSENNPYSAHDRALLIIDALDKAGIDRDTYTIIEVPNIVNITYGRDVGYKIEKETLEPEIERISASNIRKNAK